MRVDVPVLLRDATESDATSIGSVHADAWRVAYRDLFEARWLERLVATRREQWANRMAAPEFARTTILVAVRGNQVKAFAYFGPLDLMADPSVPITGDGEIYGFYADPTVWGTGVAGTLLNGTLDVLEEAGYAKVRLWTLAGANRARRFYRRHGFEETGASRERDFGDRRPVLELEYVRATR